MKIFGQFLIASTLCLLSLGSSAQGADHIKDGLELFSDKAKAAANQQIAQVHKNHGWTIAIETRDATTIADLPKQAGEQDKFLTGWTTKEYTDNRLEGVYLVVFKNPNKFRLHIDTDQQKKMGVTQADKDAWLDELKENLKEKKFDTALLATVGNISAKLSQSNSPKKSVAAPPAPQNVERNAHGGGPAGHGAADEGPSMMTWLLIAGGVFVIFMIIRSVLRGINQGNASQNPYGPGANMGGPNMGGPNMGQPGYGPGYGAPQSRGGGFMSGMLGGLFGGMAGNWMYDQFSGRRESHSDSGQGHFTSNDSGSLADNSSSAAESDSTTYGGDWGDSGGSSDSGGDSGGGDWGGDSGGGGSDGGDW